MALDRRTTLAAMGAMPLVAGTGRARSQPPGDLLAQDLRVEGVDEPAGLDLLRPRFSWGLAARDPNARGLVQRGFELIGGRLLPAGERGRAAMLLYEDAKGERISLFVTGESSEASSGTYSAESKGPEAVYWLDKGYGCAVVGSLPPERLSDIAKSAYDQLVAGISS